MLGHFGVWDLERATSFDPWPFIARTFVDMSNKDYFNHRWWRFVPAVLMTTKLFAPLLLVSTVWRVLVPSWRHFLRHLMVMLMVCEVGGLVLFLNVVGDGNPREVVVSFVQFAIVQGAVLFFFVGQLASGLLLSSNF